MCRDDPPHGGVITHGGPWQPATETEDGLLIAAQLTRTFQRQLAILHSYARLAKEMKSSRGLADASSTVSSSPQQPNTLVPEPSTLSLSCLDLAAAARDLPHEIWIGCACDCIAPSLARINIPLLEAVADHNGADNIVQAIDVYLRRTDRPGMKHDCTDNLFCTIAAASQHLTVSTAVGSTT